MQATPGASLSLPADDVLERRAHAPALRGAQRGPEARGVRERVRDHEGRLRPGEHRALGEQGLEHVYGTGHAQRCLFGVACEQVAANGSHALS